VGHPHRHGRLADPGRPGQDDDGGPVAVADLLDEVVDDIVTTGEVRQVERQLADRGERGEQCGTGCRVQLVAQDLLGLGVGLDGVGAAARGGERVDEELPQLLAQRVVTQHAPQLGGRGVVLAPGDPLPQPVLAGGEPQLGEPGGGRVEHVALGQVGQEPAAPQVRVAGLLEPAEVDLPGLGPQQVAAGPVLDAVVEQAAQAVHVGPHVRGRRAGW
jgi:hypothetical protein